jgi:hypothetical protein
MKKKIVFSLGLMVLVAIFCSNIKLCHEASLKTITLSSIGLWSHASAESSNSNKCNGSLCKDGNDLKYGTFTSQAGEVVCCGQATTTRGKLGS